MDERTFAALELAPLVELLLRHIQTPLGRRKAQRIQPSLDPAEIEQALSLTSEGVEYLRSSERFALSGIEDPDAAFARLQIQDTSLEAHQILAMERLVSTGMELRDQFRSTEMRQHYPLLSSATGRMPDLRRLLSEIRGKILPGGEVDDNASPELRAIRREMNGARARVQRTLESILQRETRAIQDEIVTFRNGRFVIPVRTDSRNLVPGVVHGLSSSGQTTFVEPLTAIEQNNEIVRLREQEEIEIARILFSITEALRVHLADIRFAAETIAEIDFVQAKARFALEFHCIRPRISHDLQLVIEDGRHVLLEQALCAAGEKVVPISLSLDQQHHVMVLSGPNAGGKTVVLKTVGLMALMSQMGLHVPAREAVLPVFRQVFADIGDQQSIAANLSTFTAHLRNISEMAKAVVPPALVLLDEVGTGTDPDEGAALAVAIVDFFRRAGVTTLASTHYSGVKMWAAQTPDVRNASVEFDERTLRPTYRLLLGIAGASAGLEIARRMNLPEEILGPALRLVDPGQAQASEYLKRLKSGVDEQELQLKALAEDRAASARERARLEQEFARREETRRADFDAALKEAMIEFRAESDRLLASLKERTAAERVKKTAEKRMTDLRRAAEKLRSRQGAAGLAQHQPGQALSDHAGPGNSLSDIQEGDRVRILSLGREGSVESIQADTCTIVIGALRFRTERADIQATGSRHTARVTSQVSAAAADLDQVVVHEVNIIGMTADEATDRADKFLDEAFLAGADSVRIIHGHGKGILRRAIARLLTGHPQVESFALAPHDGGGAAIAIVTLRK